MKRALVEGRERFELLVGAAVLANNLMVIADRLRRTQARRRRPAAYRRNRWVFLPAQPAY